MARRYVGKEAEFKRNGFVLVDMQLDGTVIEALSPRRLFPTSDKTHYISLLDEDGKEMAIIRDLNELSEESRSAIDEVLREYYIVPKITAVLAINDKGGSMRWTVMTDRGECSFQIKSRITDIKPLNGGRVLFRDASDNRYEIEDWTKLDKHSRHLLNSQI